MEEKETTLRKIIDVISVFLIIIAVHLVVGIFNGKWPWDSNPYNSYFLQAKAWTEGRLDLGMDYPYLELAIFKEKYFVSFPPFPSYILFPFVLIFGDTTPEGIIAFIIMLLGAFYGLRLAWNYLGAGAKAIFWTCFLYVGINSLYITLDAGVWFIAQSCALTTSLMAIYYASKGKGGASLFFWGCSVGCRPLQAVYFPLLFYFLYRKLKEEKPERNLLAMIKEKYLWALPVCIIAISYMILNYARFGNPIEFGHNYLPEFVREENGQFHINYVMNNLKNVFRMPVPQEDGTLGFWLFDGVNIFLVIPMFVSYIIYIIRSIVRRQKLDLIFMIALPILIMGHIVALCAHRTMGGFHFGNRYIVDTAPYLLWGILIYARGHMGYSLPKKESKEQETDASSSKSDGKTDVTDDANKLPPDYTYCLHYALFAFGLGINLVGTIATNMQWLSSI